MSQPTSAPHEATLAALVDVAAERRRQLDTWGPAGHPDGTGSPDWAAERDAQRAYVADAVAAGDLAWIDLLREEVAEAFAETDPDLLRAELVQVAAVATAWVEDLDHRRATTTVPDADH